MTALASIIIGICGISGSGKTEVTRALSQALNHSSMIFWDDFESISEYPPDYVEWYKNSKDYSAWKTPALAQVLQNLKLGRTITCPVTSNLLKPSEFIIYDAPLGRNHIETGKYIDFLIFLDTPPDIALIRRLKRDYLHYQPVDVHAIQQELNTYVQSTRPLFLDISSLKTKADLVISGTASVQDIVKKIIGILTNEYGHFF